MCPPVSRMSHRETGVKVLAGPFLPVELTGNHAYRARAAVQGDRGDLLIPNFLVVGRRHLEPGRQVDPELDHFHRAPLAGKPAAVKLFVNDSGSGGHPLHVAGTNGAVVAGRVAMLQLALIDDGHGFKTPMGVLFNAARLGGRRKLVRTRVIEQQERADRRPTIMVGKQAADRKSVSHPMRLPISKDSLDRFHFVLPCFRAEHLPHLCCSRLLHLRKSGFAAAADPEFALVVFRDGQRSRADKQ